jgi:Uma2 family endonuclease
LLIIEILSPGTDRDDVFVKLPVYQRIPSVQEILYVETEWVGRRCIGAPGIIGKHSRLQAPTHGLSSRR